MELTPTMSRLQWRGLGPLGFLTNCILDMERCQRDFEGQPGLHGSTHSYLMKVSIIKNLMPYKYLRPAATSPMLH